MDDLLRLGIGPLRDALEAGTADAAAVAEASLARIEELGHLNAFVATRPEAVADARASTGPLAGVPLAVKDMFVDGGRVPTCGSRAHASWLSGTATIVARLRAAGAVVVGYTNLHEWGVGMTSALTATGPILNPWDPALVPGGSSGGSAAALAAGMVTAAIGTDAGGSIRCPSACCGTAGLKASAGRLPTEGFVGHGGPIDGVGPMARSVEDVLRLFRVMADEEADPPPAGDLRLGIPRSFFFEDLDPGVAAAAGAGMEVLRGVVADVREVDLPSAPMASFAVPGLLLPLFAELLEGADDSSFHPATAQLLAVGRGMTDEDKARAAGVRAAVAAEWQSVFEQVDVVVTPTLPGPPAAIETLMLDLPSGPASPELAYLRTNAPMNVGGVPALSLPCGFLPGGLTTNLTLTAARGRDEIALAVGLAFEAATDGVYAGRVADL